MRYYIIAGEASGDLHGSNLIKELKKQDSSAEICCWGGELMERAGGKIVKHYRELAFMGFAEVLMNLGTILSNLKLCKRDIVGFKPDAVILIDYPGFNLRIARFAKEAGFRVFYYISPQLWAWKESRVNIIKKFVDRMFVILPFEKEFYKKHKVDVDFVGHPLLDALTDNYPDGVNFRIENRLTDKPVIAILPGSRIQEIKKMLPVMLQAASHFPGYEIVIAGAPSVARDFYSGFLKQKKEIKVVFGRTYDLLANAHAAMVTSGTATLETALFEVPQVVCYKGGYLSYRIAKSLVKIKYISLVNLVMDAEIVKELIQQDFNVKNLVAELKKILAEPDRGKMKINFEKLKSMLGGPGASRKTAELIYNFLK